MPKPATLRDLVGVVRRSSLLDRRRFASFLWAVRRSGAAGAAPAALLDRMVADGLLTRFQADRLGAGKWKGFSVGGYQLLDKIGAGGMGQVYLAEHPTGGHKVAIKVLNASLARNPVARARFAREARAAAGLAHPNIVPVIDLDVDAAPPFMVMEFVDGVTLQAAVARHGLMAPGTAAHCGRHVALGLQRAAEAGLVHRDIKPANLLVDRRGVVKILDLGVVRGEADDELTRSTSRNLVLGTADYLAPEQAADSHAVDTRADIYALGGTLYFLLVGHPPFPDLGTQAKLVKKQTSDAPPVSRARPDIPPELAAAVDRMLARNPGDRFQAPAEAAAALAPHAVPDAHFPHALFTQERVGPAETADLLPDTMAGHGSAVPAIPWVAPPQMSAAAEVRTPVVLVAGPAVRAWVADPRD
ncbi:serine/threonine-protein kinase [Fimbriiglobus ruber]|uniref:Cellular communication/signal transduction protein n=1 Tax=Fimbriiglobus ruber TaxID=1908690 RepID=A0A225DHH0_9BACT|nr:serine/threonine-protein kinase [Fimbriiglobus ruber]OWK40902.1 cellular communication/signal transduction protein [Fimbriiglobus ruber]